MSQEEEEIQQQEVMNVEGLLQQITQYEANRYLVNKNKYPNPNLHCQEMDLSYHCFRKQQLQTKDLSLHEARLTRLENKRHSIFRKHIPFKQPKTQAVQRKKQLDSKEQRNQTKISEKLAQFFGRLFQNNTSELELSLYKQYNYQNYMAQEEQQKDLTAQSIDSVFQIAQKIGYIASQPKIDPNKIPTLSYQFEEAYKAQIQDSKGNQRNKKQRAKQTNKNEYQITSQSEYMQTIFQQELYEDPIEYGDFRKAYQIVMKNMIKIGRFKFKYRQDLREFFKRLIYQAAKESRRRYQKCQKYQKDFVVRAKKLSKEAYSYWRKRDKELIEIKKRKEKLEQERKKKEEEEREQQLQQKRLEFLMKQSDIYAHFMAKKLGIDLDNHISNNGYMIAEGEEEIAFETVQRVINDNRKQLQSFDGGKQDNVQISELKLDHNDQTTDFSLIVPPSTFNGELKEYQLKGLRWLDNLYEQGINGILADEMGLGKTIQAIALLTHISNHKNVWGPFLVVAPSSTLHNWQQEIKKFSPTLKVLPYWGQSGERKTIRKYFQQKNFGRKDSLFHVVVTSYNLVVSDNKIINRVRWQYMILDEAQAIKNINSQRWQILLSFNARNRLLLTGTPIQNTMGELWALLHFIMPKFFDSFEQFQEWFSKDIEAHSQDQKTLNQHQLQRLHAILKPFMLRRLKKDVENEIGQKKEVQIVCEMTSRQYILYKNIKQKLSIKEFFRMLDSKQKVDNLMNLVMQFRKICNHPELFERKPYRSPYSFQDKQNVEVYQLNPKVQVTQYNPIKFIVPKFVYDRLSQNRIDLYIFTAHYIYQSLQYQQSAFSFIQMLNLRFNIFEKHIFEILYQTKLDQERRELTLQYYPNHQKYKYYTVQIGRQHLIDYQYPKRLSVYIPKTQAMPIDILCRSQEFINNLHYHLHPPQYKITESIQNFILPNSPESLIAQSSKLLQLDKLLKELKQKQWRVLIFCQMTKMLDILEEYMLHKGYTYFRMDGQCQINDRRDMVNEFQTNDKVFAFLLSTRAGGLGITLTQADAVIFYDNDWNPTMDAQATDRAHRIGRTKDVYVYRLITKGTIEERIVKRAQQKQNVQSTVYSGGFQGDKFKPQEVFELLFDEQEMDDNVTNKFMNKATKKKKKVIPKKADEQSQNLNQQQQQQQQQEDDVIEVDLGELELNEKDNEDAD